MIFKNRLSVRLTSFFTKVFRSRVFVQALSTTNSRKMAKSVRQSATIDEALEETKFGKFNYFVICVSGLILINVILETLGISFVLPITKSDTTGRKRVIQPTLFAGYLVSIVSSFSPNFLTLVVLRYVNGFLVSGGSATIYAYLGEFHCNKNRNRAIMSAAFICAAAAAFYPVMAWAVINQTWSFYVPYVDITYRPWRMYVLCCGVLGLVSGQCFCILPESPKYLLSAGREEEAMAVLKRVFSLNTGKSEEDYEITSITPDTEDPTRQLKEVQQGNWLSNLKRSMWRQTAPLFMREHCRKTILICVIQFWVFFSAQGVYIWFPSLLDSVMQFTAENPSEKYQICEIFYRIEGVHQTTPDNGCDQTLELDTFKYVLYLEFIYIGIFLVVGWFTGKVGRILSLFLILSACGVCGVLCALVNIPVLAVYCLVVLLICGIGTTVLNAISVDMFPTHLRAMAVCISLMIGRIGSVVGTNVIGSLLEYHCQQALLFASSFLILSGFFAFLLPKGLS